MKNSLVFSGLAIIAFSSVIKAENSSVLENLENKAANSVANAAQKIAVKFNVGKALLSQLLGKEFNEEEAVEEIKAIDSILQAIVEGAIEGGKKALQNLSQEQVDALINRRNELVKLAASQGLKAGINTVKDNIGSVKEKIVDSVVK